MDVVKLLPKDIRKPAIFFLGQKLETVLKPANSQNNVSYEAWNKYFRKLKKLTFYFIPSIFISI